MKKIIISLILFLFSSGFVFAVDIVYPIPELGNCADKKACENYCNKSENMESCINYAEKNNLMTKEEIKISKAVAIKIKEGKMPGNCNDKKTCENYCQGNVANLDECLAFADEIGMTDDSIIEGKKIAKALKEGVNLPGNCKTKNECKTYCADLNNIDECLNFGDKAGIIDPEELSEAKKVIAFIKSGETPGKCKRKVDCDAYCKIESNFAECLAFAEKAGFVSKEEAELAKEGAENLKAGLEKIPLEARPDAESCLNNIFDGRLQDVLDKKVPITRIQGEKIGSCIEGAVSKYVEKMKQQAAPQGGNIPEGVQGPPVNIPTGTPPPTGVQQGPPCSSPEECMKMFGPR